MSRRRGSAFRPARSAWGSFSRCGVPDAAPAERKSGWVFAVARLKSGVSLDEASVNLAALAATLEREHPSQNQESEDFPLSLRDALVGDTRRPLVLMLAAVAVVLLVACANVGNLLLSRALGRKREMAVRVALGAGRGQLAAQLLAESLVLAVVAGAAGVALAYWGAPALVALVPRSVAVPGLRDVGINRGVLAFALGADRPDGARLRDDWYCREPSAGRGGTRHAGRSRARAAPPAGLPPRWSSVKSPSRLSSSSARA